MIPLFRYHPRLWIGIAVGVVAALAAPAWLSPLTRVLVGWNVGVVVFLASIFAWMRSLSAEQICSRFAEEDNSATFILVVVIFAALLSVVAIVEPLATVRQVQGWRRIAHLALAGVTLVDSWVLVPTLFTTHYADMYYGAPEDDRPLAFPDTSMPVFLDFAYFSFTIAAACQTSDVSTRGAAVRGTVIVHTVIAFFFNASILGFAINVTAGLIGAS